MRSHAHTHTHSCRRGSSSNLKAHVHIVAYLTRRAGHTRSTVLPLSSRALSFRKLQRERKKQREREREREANCVREERRAVYVHHRGWAARERKRRTEGVRTSDSLRRSPISRSSRDGRRRGSRGTARRSGSQKNRLHQGHGTARSEMRALYRAAIAGAKRGRKRECVCV